MNAQACPREGMKTLLLATDGGESSKSALRNALNLSKLCSSNLIIVAVVATHHHYESAFAWHKEIERLEQEMRDRLEPIRRLASEEGVSTEIIIRNGEDTHTEIVEEAIKNRAGMVIMGTHGRTGIDRLLKGSVTAGVIGSAPCSVLVVPSGVTLNYETILVATDGSPHSATAISEAINLARKCDGSLFVLSVASSDTEISLANDNVSQAMELAEKENIKREGLVIQGKPYETIVEVSKQKGADLIIVGSHGRTGLMHLLMGSVTEQVIGHADVSVLVVKTDRLHSHDRKAQATAETAEFKAVKMYEKAIVAIDGSESSLNALRQSFRIEKAQITGVCIAPRYEGDLELLDLGLIKDDIQALLRAPCEKAVSNADEIARQENATLRTVWEFGAPPEGILDVAQARGGDLIVMGRKGYSRLERAFIGSVTARIIGYSPVDVLVIPEGASLRWRTILLATDGSEYSKKAAVRAMTIAREYGSAFTVVSATDLAPEFHTESSELAERLCEWPRYCTTDVRDLAAKMGVHPECIVRHDKAYKAILSVAEEQEADVIVVGSHGRTGLKRLLMGSVTEKVIGYSTCPVLVVKR